MAVRLFKIKVEGTEGLALKFPKGLDHAKHEFLNGTMDRLLRNMREAAGRTVGKTWHGQVSHDRVIIESKSAVARGYERGFYIRAKKGHAIRFTSHGTTRFSMHVRYGGKHYTKKGLRGRTVIIREEYNKAYDRLPGI